MAALKAIDAERSFRGAADRLGYVQSAVSQQISALERIVGVRLVNRERGHAGVELTDAGTILVGYAGRILRQLTAAKADLRALDEGGQHVLRVGVFESVATHIIPNLLARMKMRRPELQILTTEMPGDGDLFAAVESGELDCAFADLPLEPGPFELAELYVDPCVLLVPSDSPLATRADPPTLREIAKLPLARHNWRFLGLIEQRFRAEGLTLRSKFDLETNSAVRALVSAGFAAAIMPRLSACPLEPRSSMVCLDRVLPPRTIVAFWHEERNPHPALAPFLNTCRGVFRELADGRRVGSGSDVRFTPEQNDGSLDGLRGAA